MMLIKLNVYENPVTNDQSVKNESIHLIWGISVYKAEELLFQAIVDTFPTSFCVIPLQT